MTDLAALLSRDDAVPAGFAAEMTARCMQYPICH